MATEVNSTSPGSSNISDLYKDLWETYLYTENTTDASSSPEYHRKLQRGITSGEQAIHMVNQLHLFSENENIDEVTTNEVRYLLLPAILGYLTTLQSSTDPAARMPTIQKSKDYFTDFLRMCKCYEITDFELPSDESSALAPSGKGPPDFAAMSKQREAKIKRFKEQKERSQKLKDLSVQVEKEHVDDEIKREYYITLCKEWIDKGIEEMDNLNSEVAMLKFREQSLQNGHEVGAQKKETKKKEAFRPFIITRDMIQKRVFGAGYPALPMMTVEEFYEEKVREGTMQVPSGSSLQDRAADPERDARELEKEESEKERKIEEDDAETLQKAREWDDWKDDHRRGWGNRKNQG